MTVRIQENLSETVKENPDSKKIIYTISLYQFHSVKSVHIRSSSAPYFPPIRTEYSVSLRIQSKCGKIWTRKSPTLTLFTQCSTLTLQALHVKIGCTHIMLLC